MNLSKRQLSLFRGNGGSLSPLQAALAQFGFWAPLETSVALYRGYGAASFTRTTTATVKDWEGAIRNCVSGEVRFAGQRRVRNLIGTSSLIPSSLTSCTSVATNIAAPDGTLTAQQVSISAPGFKAFWAPTGGPVGGTSVGSVYLQGVGASIGKTISLYFYDGTTEQSLGPVTLAAGWQRFSSPITHTTAATRWGVTNQAGGTITTGDSFNIVWGQLEPTTGQSNQNPSEYVSVGAAKLNELLQTDLLISPWNAVGSGTRTQVSLTTPIGPTATKSQTSFGTTAFGVYSNFSGAGAVDYTFSIYAKAGTYNYLALDFGNTGNAGAVFDLSDGSIGFTDVGVSSSVTSVGDGWYRCAITKSGAGAYPEVYLSGSRTANTRSWTAAGTEYFYHVGAQLERASSAGTYFPVGSVYPYHGACVDGVKYFSTQNGNTVASNVVTEATGPAITRSSINEYGYLAESARTNLVLQSSNFGTTWLALGTPTRSAAAAYCGEIALDLIGDDDAGALEEYYQQIAFTADASKSVSFLVKQGTSTSTLVAIYDTVGAYRLLMVITWSDGVPVCTYTNGSAERVSEYMGGGVWRIFCLAASVIAANVNIIRFFPASNAAAAVANTGDIYIGGVQAENATTASASHIPTTTATVTRNADVMSYPLENISSSTGSAYAESAGVGGNTQGRWVDSGSGVALGRTGGLGTSLGFYDGTAFRVVGSVGAGVVSTALKVCSVWDGAACAGAVNGVVTSGVAFDGNAGFTTAIFVGGNSSVEIDSPIKNVRIATVALTDADLQLITQ